jgi:hypothetical protein
MAELSELQARLAEAELAYHKLMTGNLEASVGSGDMQVTFSRVELPGLRNYIADLKSQIATAQGQSLRGCRRLEIYY